MTEPDTDPTSTAPAARWTDYEVSYTLGGNWTAIELSGSGSSTARSSWPTCPR